MRKVYFLICAIWGLCAFSELPDSGQSLTVESDSKDWNVEMLGNSVIKAFNPKGQVEILINVENLLPQSPQCVSNKRIKDIKMTLSIRKVAMPGDRDWAKAFEKTRINFSGSGGGERRVYGSNLIKNNYKAQEGAVVNVGTLEFLSPVTCDNLVNSSMRISGMMSQGRTLPTLSFSIKPKKN